MPVLVTDGGTSPAWLRAIVAELSATTHRQAARHTFPAAGHVPHLTHPDQLVAVVRSFTAGSVLAISPASGSAEQ